MVTGIGLAVPAPASAAKSDCSNGTYCIWASTGYTGTRTTFTPPAPGACINFVYPYNDQADSVYNHSSTYLSLWSGFNGTGSSYGLLAGNSNSDLASLSPYFGRNIASSLCNF